MPDMPDRIRLAPRPRLVDALEPPRADAGAPERLGFREHEIPPMFGVSLRLWQRAVLRGEAPQADIRLGRIKIWSRDLLVRWIASAGSINGK
jgi:hypothetical protein